MHLTVGLPKFLWTESVQHAVWLKNRTSTRALDGKTPYELVHGVKPDLSNLPEWGTRVFVLKEDSGKLEAKADEGRWIGYSDESKGHRVYWPGRHRVTVERNVTFDAPVLITPTDALTEGESVTHGSQGIGGAPHGQILPPQPQPAADPERIDPLEGFEAADPPADLPQGRRHRTRKPSAYVRGIADGTGSSTGRSNAPAYPRGLPLPSNSSALVTLIELEEGTAIEIEGEAHRPFEYSMAAAAAHDTRPNQPR